MEGFSLVLAGVSIWGSSVDGSWLIVVGGPGWTLTVEEFRLVTVGGWGWGLSVEGLRLLAVARLVVGRELTGELRLESGGTMPSFLSWA